MWLLVFIMGFATALTFSNALLHSSKTATGAISFDLKSPSISLNNGLKLNYDANVGEFGTLTYGDSAYDILNLDALDLSVDSGNLISNYYVKLIYDFSNLAGTVSFAQNSYNFGSAKMSTMTSTNTKNEFYTISSSNGSADSPATITKSDTNKFNVLTFLRDFQYVYDSTLTESTKLFAITVIVDLNENCNSSSRSQISVTGTINTKILTLKVSANGACYMDSNSGVSSLEIPYKVKLGSDDTIIEKDMDGTATGSGWTTITSIAPNGFSGCTNLTSISNNGSITSIGDDAFAGCTKLSTIGLDFTKITNIGINTATNTNALGDTAFYKALPYASGDTGIVTYGDILFEYKTQCEILTLSNYRIVAPFAFKSQTALTTITIDSTIKNINNFAFDECSKLLIVDLTSMSSDIVLKEDAFSSVNNNPLALKVNTTDTNLEKKIKNSTPLRVDLSVKQINGYYTYASKGQKFKLCLKANNTNSNKDCIMIEIEKILADNYDSFSFVYDEKYLLISTGSPNVSFNFESDIYVNKSSYWYESIGSYYNDDNDTKVVNFQTPNGSQNHITVSPTLQYTNTFEKGFTHYFNGTMTLSAMSCFTPDSKIQLANGGYVLAKDVTYNDLLLTWNFDEGCFAASYPVWLTKSTKIEEYFKFEFEDGTYFNSIVSHSVYSADENRFVKSIDAIYSQEGHYIVNLAVDEDGNALRDANGNFYHVKKKVKKITKIYKEVQVINIVTAYHLNNYINGVLGSTSFSNIYDFTPMDENGAMKYNQEQFIERTTGTNTLYTIDEFDNTIITKNIFQGWRIAQQKGARTIEEVTKYITWHNKDIDPLPTDADGNRIYALSTSDGYKTTIK